MRPALGVPRSVPTLLLFPLAIKILSGLHPRNLCLNFRLPLSCTRRSAGMLPPFPCSRSYSVPCADVPRFQPDVRNFYNLHRTSKFFFLLIPSVLAFPFRQTVRLLTHDAFLGIFRSPRFFTLDGLEYYLCTPTPPTLLFPDFRTRVFF